MLSSLKMYFLGFCALMVIACGKDPLDDSVWSVNSAAVDMADSCYANSMPPKARPTSVGVNNNIGPWHFYTIKPKDDNLGSVSLEMPNSNVVSSPLRDISTYSWQTKTTYTSAAYNTTTTTLNDIVLTTIEDKYFLGTWTTHSVQNSYCVIDGCTPPQPLSCLTTYQIEGRRIDELTTSINYAPISDLNYPPQ